MESGSLTDGAVSASAPSAFSNLLHTRFFGAAVVTVGHGEVAS